LATKTSSAPNRCYSYSRAEGTKTSPNFTPTDPPANDFWLIRLNTSGDKLWEQVYGGTGFDNLHTLEVTQDGGAVLGGDSASDINGNKTSPSFGQQDFWVVKLGPDALSAPPHLTASAQSFDEIAQLGFRMHLHGVSNVTYVIDFSTAFETWIPLQTNVVSGAPLEIVDPAAANEPHRFYRARLDQ
jgi:hypothetical protein